MPVPGFMGIVRGIQSQVSGWPQVRSIIGNRVFATSALLLYFPVQLPKGFGTVSNHILQALVCQEYSTNWWINKVHLTHFGMFSALSLSVFGF